MTATTDRSVDKRAQLMARVDAHIEELAQARDAADLTARVNAYAALQARFHRYSLCNALLIHAHLAERGKEPTDVAGFTTWIKMGRVPRKGSGIPILAPARYKEEDQETGEQWYVLRGFKVVYVFDAQDTDVLPGKTDLYRSAQLQWTPVDGDYSPLLKRLLDCARAQGIRVEIGPGQEGSGVRGWSDGRGLIWLNSALSSGESCGTMLHELCHELCHNLERRREAKQQVHGKARLEAEAEAAAYCLCGHLNVPRPNSGLYLALHNISATDLRSSLEAIRLVVCTVLSAIDGDQDITPTQERQEGSGVVRW